jgi:excinuclease UvrABC ATPase subunit
MSWEYSTKRKCEKCGFEYNVEESTLTNMITNYDICPKCRGKGNVISSRSVDDAINEAIEIIKNRRKTKNAVSI